jgi:hypothetical protein
MANLIITVIAIALVSIAAMMSAYYGGATFLNNQSAANASTVLNQAAQIAGAWNAYLGDNLNIPPSSMTLLTQGNNIASGGYVQSIPNAPQGPGGVSSFPIVIASATATLAGTSGTHYFAYADMGRPSTAGASVSDPNATACVRIQKTALGKSPTALASVGQGTIFSSGNGTFGCAILTGTITGGLGGTAVPAGDLQTGDYVMEYLLE